MFISLSQTDFPSQRKETLRFLNSQLQDLCSFEDEIDVDHVCIAHGLSCGSDCISLLPYMDQWKGKAHGTCVIDPATV